jgi:hypothetical protein
MRVYRFSEHTDSLFDIAPIKQLSPNEEKAIRWVHRSAFKIMSIFGSIEQKRTTGINSNMNSSWFVEKLRISIPFLTKYVLICVKLVENIPFN